LILASLQSLEQPVIFLPDEQGGASLEVGRSFRDLENLSPFDVSLSRSLL
jgi:hypothetical protein